MKLNIVLCTLYIICTFCNKTTDQIQCMRHEIKAVIAEVMAAVIPNSLIHRPNTDSMETFNSFLANFAQYSNRMKHAALIEQWRKQGWQ